MTTYTLQPKARNQNFMGQAPKLAINAESCRLESMKSIHYTLYREESDYVAQCLDFDISSFGATRQEAMHNLKEAVELYLEDRPEAAAHPVISDVSVGQLAIA